MSEESILSQAEPTDLVDTSGDNARSAVDATDSKITENVANLAVGDATASPSPSGTAASADVPDANVRSNTGIATKLQNRDEMMYVYNMNHKRRGMAIIINNLHFDASTGMSERMGTDQDALSLCKVFKSLDFEIKLFKDMTKRKMLKLMYEAARDVDHTNNDCFVCVILSHGEEGEIYGKDGKIPIEDLVAPFKGDQCRSLAGKPKLFFLQACRGSNLDGGVEVTDHVPDEDQVDSVAHRIPVEADFLMSYSVVSGYFSWRNSARGSWFIQSLCDVLEKHGTSMEITRILTRVNHKVAYDFESNAAKEFMNRKKQIPCFVSMLTKEVYFPQKKFLS